MLPERGFPETRPSLLATLCNGEPVQSAWRDFFERYAPAVFRVARRQGLGTHDADDIVQQVMCSIAAHIGEFDYDRDRGRFRQWVKTVTANKVRDLFRHQAAAPRCVRLDSVAEPGDAASDIEAVWDEEWDVQDLLWCLDEIRPDIAPHRYEAFRLYVLEGISAEEAGRRVGMSRAHVYVTRAQIVKRLRAVMTRLEAEARPLGERSRRSRGQNAKWGN